MSAFEILSSLGSGSQSSLAPRGPTSPAEMAKLDFEINNESAILRAQILQAQQAITQQGAAWKESEQRLANVRDRVELVPLFEKLTQVSRTNQDLQAKLKRDQTLIQEINSRLSSYEQLFLAVKAANGPF